MRMPAGLQASRVMRLHRGADLVGVERLSGIGLHGAVH
jgi:hypothetical protein